MIQDIKRLTEFDFKLFLIDSKLNKFNFSESNILKSPGITRETEFSLSGYTNTTSGVGLYLGHNQVYAIDIDGILNYDFIKKLLKDMKLPEDYPWVIESGSKCGYHILFKTNLPKKNLNTTLDKINEWNRLGEKIPFGEYDVNAYYAYFQEFIPGVKNKPCFFKIEFLWTGEIVLPPSLHSSGNYYSFVNGFPDHGPSKVDFKVLSSSTWPYRNEQAHRSQFLDSGGIDPAHPDAQFLNITEYKSFKYGLPDSINYNYQSKFQELSTVILLGQYYISNNLFLNQISWFVVDNSYNVKKRKLYNYLSKNKLDSDYKISKIDQEIVNKISSPQRNIYFELLFDIEHTRKIVYWNDTQLRIIQKEILNSGLYLDAFLSSIYLHPRFISKYRYIQGLHPKFDLNEKEELLKKLNVISEENRLIKKMIS
ncbi:bifunctional DNA primase/polymerase [Luteirhabdus pelagi]|uniref:bifunctional DNA primase/polymerase n=1 Tax=Luteirhabdus pelagi TaxID=2792783 RepID=UPI001939E369|nr:bifunctional DNA primase/polymerase [Luteirhabdus pelagi]